jgi:hypothetical protein
VLRPWVSFIALLLAALLLWQVAPGILPWLGGGLLGLALLNGYRQELVAWWKRRRVRQKVVELDWKIIDNSLAQDRLVQDCERPETLGVCTGRECLVYDSCQFNIKKPLP